MYNSQICSIDGNWCWKHLFHIAIVKMKPKYISLATKAFLTIHKCCVAKIYQNVFSILQCGVMFFGFGIN